MFHLLWITHSSNYVYDRLFVCLQNEFRQIKIGIAKSFHSQETRTATRDYTDSRRNTTTPPPWILRILRRQESRFRTESDRHFFTYLMKRIVGSDRICFVSFRNYEYQSIDYGISHKYIVSTTLNPSITSTVEVTISYLQTVT